jgi:hypothetical protein
VGIAAANANGLTYTAGAVEPGNPGRIGQTTFAGPIVLTQTTVNITMNAIASNFIESDLGGFSDTVNMAGYNVPIVQVPFGTIAADATVAFTPVANPDPTNVYMSGSGTTLYQVVIDQTVSGSIIITLPFDLTVVHPGDFMAGTVSINKAPTLDDLLNGTNITSVAYSDIVSIDWIGDGLVGLVSFQVSSLSVFGIGAPVAAVGEGGDDFCFINSSAPQWELW